MNDTATPAISRRVPLTVLCQQNQAETAPVVGRILPAEEDARIPVAAFNSSV